MTPTARTARTAHTARATLHPLHLPPCLLYYTPFRTKTRDAHSNPTGRGGDSYIATIVGPHEASPAFRRSSGQSASAEKPEIITCEIVDRGDGTHEVSHLVDRWTARAVLALPHPSDTYCGRAYRGYSYYGRTHQVSYLIDLVGHYAMTVDNELGDQIAGSPFELFIVGGVSSAPHSVPRRLDLTTALLTPLWLHLLWLYSPWPYSLGLY